MPPGHELGWIEAGEPDGAKPVPCDMCGCMGVPGWDLEKVLGKQLCAGADDCAGQVRWAVLHGWRPDHGVDWENVGVTQRWRCWLEGGMPRAMWFAAYDDWLLVRALGDGALCAADREVARRGGELWNS